ncbi:MAG: hypothetical protein E7426_07090 [Ruminococcaceae bacterium]|nr:hypothetical protein [Oscillospiraceae bacterium]
MKKRELPPLIAVAVILLGLSVVSLLLPDRDFSDNENRYLQQSPELTAQRVLSGRFTEEAEKYESDQIALRDMWMGAASTLQRLAGKQDIGGVYLGRDGYYFARLTEDEFDQSQYEKNLRAVCDFFDAHPDIDGRILLAPSPAAVLAELLPADAPMYDAAPRHDQLAETVGEDRTIDVREVLSALSEPYYRTDHHWTTAGAQAAYNVWCGATGHEVRSRISKAVSTTFRGTLYSKVLLPDSACDTIYLPQNVTIRSMDCDGTVTDSLYDMDKLQEKDQYAVFMGGNWARVTIETGTENGRHLLLVKDSFANSFVPFLVEDYETITLLDLRYFNDSVPELLAERSVTDMLVLYELSNFAADRNLFKLSQDW